MRVRDISKIIEKFIFDSGMEEKRAPSLYRTETEIDATAVKQDVHESYGSTIFYLRIASENQPFVLTIINDCITERFTDTTLGLVIKLQCIKTRCLLWFPTPPVQAQLDEHARLTPSTGGHYLWNIASSVELQFTSNDKGQTILIPMVLVTSDVDDVYEELTALAGCERRLYLKSEWFFSNDPGYVWRYLINGSVYDPRSSRSVGKRFKCQQCGYAWWSYFDYLHSQTNKRIWLVLRDEIALCALKDMEETGAWRNGFWSDDMEIHSRFQLDGLHLLISQYEKSGSQEWLDAAERGMTFVRERLTEALDDGSVWYLHDDVHDSRRHKIRSTAFGKTTSNSLCINTHIQALTVIHRLALLSDRESDPYEAMYQQGICALLRIMGHQPAHRPYSYVVPRMLALARETRQSTLSLVMNRVKKRLLVKIYWELRARYPRIVQPNGFIERDLTVEIASDRYHVTNLKDLLVLYLQRPIPWLRSYIKNGYGYLMGNIREIGIEEAIISSPYFIEVADILYMYNKSIEPVCERDLSNILEGIYRQTDGCSLDYHASDLVHTKMSDCMESD